MAGAICTGIGARAFTFQFNTFARFGMDGHPLFFERKKRGRGPRAHAPKAFATLSVTAT
jgi:hypothetical protein